MEFTPSEPSSMELRSWPFYPLLLNPNPPKTTMEDGTQRWTMGYGDDDDGCWCMVRMTEDDVRNDFWYTKVAEGWHDERMTRGWRRLSGRGLCGVWFDLTKVCNFLYDLWYCSYLHHRRRWWTEKMVEKCANGEDEEDDRSSAREDGGKGNCGDESPCLLQKQVPPPKFFFCILKGN